MSTPNKRPKLGETMDVDQPSTSAKDHPQEVTKELQKKGTQLYWKLKDLKSRYKELTGTDFKHGEREAPEHDVKVLHYDFTAQKDRTPEKVDETTLRPLDKACTGCGTRSNDNTVFGKSSTMCAHCKKKSTKSYLSNICTGIPQLKNECGPVWTPGIQLVPCQRCLLDRLGRTDIDNSPPPLSTQEQGYARFQDLAQVDLKGLLGDAETEAVLARVMNFSIENERVLGNILLKYHRDDVRLKTTTGLRQIVAGGVRAITLEAKKTSNNVKLDLVKLEEEHIQWSPEFNGWTPTATCDYNNYCFADILATPHLNAMPGQGITTRIVNLSFTINQKFKYLSLTNLKFHLQSRGASIEWVPALNGQMWNRKGSHGEIYMEGMELDDGIYIYIGSTGGDRHHQQAAKTALIDYKTAHPSAKAFKTTLYYSANKCDLRLHESQFMIVFLLAQLHECPFKNFTPPCPATTTFTNCLSWKEFSPDKLIKVMNNNIIGKNYSIDQLNQIGNFSSVLLKWKAEVAYDWNNDQLKYIKPPSKAGTIM